MEGNKNIRRGEQTKEKGRLMIVMSHNICSFIGLLETIETWNLLKMLHILSSIHN